MIFRILQVPAAYAPVDPDAPPALSTHFMKKCNLKYILVEKQQINVSIIYLNYFLCVTFLSIEESFLHPPLISEFNNSAGFLSLNTVDILGWVIVVRSVLYILQCLVTSLVSTHQMPDNQNCFQTLPNVSWKCSPSLFPTLH